jgi:hypothetical protein
MNPIRFAPSRCWVAGKALILVVFAGALVGCGPSYSPVSGTVTHNGEKVKGGTVMFSPIAEGTNAPGPPVSATVEADGSYTLKSGTTLGGVVGKNKVSYTAGGGEESKDPNKQGTPSPYANLKVKEETVEVKPGSNTINIELVK